MRNERNAGRKPTISVEQIDIAKKRIESGERLTAIAKELGISRQGLYNRIKNTNSIIKAEYYVDGEFTTLIEVDVIKESIHIVNYAKLISQRAFGMIDNPEWSDFKALIERCYLYKEGIENNLKNRLLCTDVADETIYLNHDLLSQGNGLKFDLTFFSGSIPRFEFTKKDILLTRTDTDGFQLKAISRDRRYFVKAQAIIGGIKMNDYAVEILSSSLCRQLDIPCVLQRKCEFIYNGQSLMGVYSNNFELDGYTFISFERLIERMGLSTNDGEFIRLNAIDKLRWCADKLSKAGSIEYSLAHKYMLDLAVIDILVGNVDRHTKNFGLFYNTNTGEYEIPLIFDNGMGLFEHDYYRDNYNSFEAAMGNVYVSPYGEDPFDMLKILDEEYDLRNLYPQIDNLDYESEWMSDNASEYIKRIKEFWK